jgi:hypothetical protein
VPVVAFSVGEEELRGVDTKPLVGHLAAWNYFMSLKSPVNDEWKKKWAAYTKAKKLPGADKPLTNDPMEAAYIGVYMWKQAVEKAKSTDVDKVTAGNGGPDVQCAFRHHVQDGREEPSPPQGSVHRRSEGRRSVQRSLEDPRPDQGPAVEPVHSRQRQEEGRAALMAEKKK